MSDRDARSPRLKSGVRRQGAGVRSQETGGRSQGAEPKQRKPAGRGQEEPMIKKLDHIAIAVHKVEEASEFYQDKLGLTLEPVSNSLSLPPRIPPW
jgi:hypothetical protein